MIKIYEAEGTEKRDIIEVDNNYLAFDMALYKKKYIDVKDMLMVGRTNSSEISSTVDLTWSLNGITPDKSGQNDIIIIDQFVKHIDQGLENVYKNNTYFNKPIKLSRKSIVLMSLDKYNQLIENDDMKKILHKINVRAYEGQEDLAIKMIFYERRYVYFDMDDEGYVLNKDNSNYANILIERQKELVKRINRLGKNITYGNKEKDVKSSILTTDENDKFERIEDSSKTQRAENYKMITGITAETEGEINLGKDLTATTDIGKARERQEDAVLLIKDKENPDFKMMVVADGVGGMLSGNVASDVVVNNLKDWFENLSEIEKSYYYTDVSKLQESLNNRIIEDIQNEIEDRTEYAGASTLVCAIVGRNNTLITNIGDSRAYYFKDGKLEQISIEDTYANLKLEEGKLSSKEAARFDDESRHITQCIGMGRRKPMNIHNNVINNNEYDMMLLFSDGVTDCLSDEDIAVVCKNTDKKELTNKIVEKAIRHDSIVPDELLEVYEDLNIYIPGGKDNTTAAAYIPTKDNKKDNEIER